MDTTLHRGFASSRLGPVALFLRGFPWLRGALVVSVSTALALVLVMTDGNILAAGALLALLAVVGVTVYRVDWGFYVFFFMVLLFDQFTIPGIRTITLDIGYFNNLNMITWLPKFDQGVVNPVELQLLMIFSLWFLTVLVRGGEQSVTVPLKVPMTLLFLAIAGSIAQGFAHNGDLVVALWETRALFYMGMMILFVPRIIRTENQVRAVLWVAIAGVAVKAFQGDWRFASLGFSFGSWPYIYETLTNHEDPVFIVTLLIFLLGLLLFGYRGKQRTALLLLLIPLLMGYVAGQRRAAYASFMASVAALIVLIPSKQRKMLLSYIGVFAVVFGLYVGAFWNSYSRLGSIAQQFKATVTDEPGVRGDKDVQSTLYRKVENYNLGQTFQRAPVTGLGFGRPYDKVMKTYGSDFALGDYVAHNEVLWIFVDMGVLGGFLFWLYFNAYVFHSAMVFRTIADPYLKALCAVCVVAVINQLVVSYVDMQLNFYRNMIYLGIFMGLVPVLKRIDEIKTMQAIEERNRQ